MPYNTWIPATSILKSSSAQWAKHLFDCHAKADAVSMPIFSAGSRSWNEENQLARLVIVFSFCVVTFYIHIDILFFLFLYFTCCLFQALLWSCSFHFATFAHLVPPFFFTRSSLCIYTLAFGHAHCCCCCCASH